MNAAIRAVVRTAAFDGLKVQGVFRGYQGLIEGDLMAFGPRSVANIVQRGGTILRTARSEAFETEEGRRRAALELQERSVDGLIVIGGDGSFRGALELHEEHGLQVVGIPATIDNDINGTDVSVGFSTALDVALDAADRLRDTAASHDRVFLIEVMGRHAGHIALHVGVASGAEATLVPEVQVPLNDVCDLIIEAEERGKSSSVIVVAEGAYSGGGAQVVERALLERAGYDVRTVILGHTQRGGSPNTRDRVLASRLGFHAVRAIRERQGAIMVGSDRRRVVHVPLAELPLLHKDIDRELLEIASVLAI